MAIPAKVIFRSKDNRSDRSKKRHRRNGFARLRASLTLYNNLPKSPGIDNTTILAKYGNEEMLRRRLDIEVENHDKRHKNSSDNFYETESPKYIPTKSM